MPTNKEQPKRSLAIRGKELFAIHESKAPEKDTKALCSTFDCAVIRKEEIISTDTLIDLLGEYV